MARPSHTATPPLGPIGRSQAVRVWLHSIVRRRPKTLLAPVGRAWLRFLPRGSVYAVPRCSGSQGALKNETH